MKIYKYFIVIILYLSLFQLFGCSKSVQSEDSPRNWKHFNIYASSEDDIIFVQLQDDLGISPKMERYILTVNLLNKTDSYILIGGEQNSTAKKFPWSALRATVQKGLLNWSVSNKEKLD